MQRFWQAFRAEIAKQHQDAAGGGGKSVFFSLLLWPVVTLATAYYSMKPYRDGAGSYLSEVIPDGNVALFLLSGFLVFQLFWTVVQAAWTFEWERKQGTLEIVYLTPASKMAFLYGRSMYALFNGIWMFTAFAAFTFLFVADLEKVAWGYLGVSLLLTFVSAMVWGAFLCSICLFSRDSGYLYYIFQAPMNLFGGVRVPQTVFPLWAKGMSLLFPVTYALYLVREALQGAVSSGWGMMALGLVAFDLALVLVTGRILVKADRHARMQGNWTMF